MLQEERFQRIRALLASFGHVSSERIAHDLGVSRETVRRDVLALEAAGELGRIHGGVKRTAVEPEPPLPQRARTHTVEKRAIVRAAARLVEPGQSLFIDAGSTVSLLAEELASLRGLTVVTNSVDVALKLCARDRDGVPRHQVRLLGGTPHAGLAATYGDATVAEILRWRVDWAMLSPVGIAADLGASSYDPAEAEVARAMVGQAQRLVLLADHSKIGLRSRVAFCGVEQIGRLITGKRARPLPALAALERAGCAVTLT